MKRLEQWRRDYDGLLSRLRQREGEAVSLRHQLTNIQAERRGCGGQATEREPAGGQAESAGGGETKSEGSQGNRGA